ncbi:MAG: adenosylmethionine decarboxylase [Candidatus Moranbacteria bacterium]|nr:adenosylmethionine decarboxylase [Candidatus Moranbacteria bacterium]
MEIYRNIKNPNPDGLHILIELYGCNSSLLNSQKKIERVFSCSIKEENVILLKRSFYKFVPRGLTGFYLLSSSHISIHTWPEFQYCTIDAFTCAGEEATKRISNKIINAIKHESCEKKEIKRGFQYKKNNSF